MVIERLWRDEECPPIILVGHSMGGALAVHTAARDYIKNLIALVVIDVVEGICTKTCFFIWMVLKKVIV